jgi:lipoyl(octanoyl) transferase
MTADPALTWQFTATTPWPGQANMDADRQTLSAVAEGRQPPTLRFFRWSEPTVSYGRLQPLETVRTLAPAGWPLVQRPTGGGIVFHDQDLCLSLAWPEGLAPLPRRPKEIYDWIHGVILQALQPLLDLRMAACCDLPESQTPFARRECFREPVGSDLLLKNQKIVGGALLHQKNGWLYQGSIQPLGLEMNRVEPALLSAFQGRLQ